jgi:hypothetical protein
MSKESEVELKCLTLIGGLNAQERVLVLMFLEALRGGPVE